MISEQSFIREEGRLGEVDTPHVDVIFWTGGLAQFPCLEHKSEHCYLVIWCGVWPNQFSPVVLPSGCCDQTPRSVVRWLQQDGVFPNVY